MGYSERVFSCLVSIISWLAYDSLCAYECFMIEKDCAGLVEWMNILNWNQRSPAMWIDCRRSESKSMIYFWFTSFLNCAAGSRSDGLKYSNLVSTTNNQVGFGSKRKIGTFLPYYNIKSVSKIWINNLKVQFTLQCMHKPKNVFIEN